MAEIDQQTESGTKSKKKLIIIILSSLVLIGGGIAGYFFLYSQPEIEEDVKTEGKETEEETAPEVFYYNLDKPFIVDFSRKSSARLVQINLAFQIEGKETMEAMKKHEPMIRNNVLMLISAKDVDSLLTREGKEQLRADILSEVGSVLTKMTGTNTVNEVFFTSFVAQ